MAKKISDLVAATQLGDNDSFVFNDVVAGKDKRVTAAGLKSALDLATNEYVNDKASLSGIENLREYDISKIKSGDSVTVLSDQAIGEGKGGKFYALNYQVKSTQAKGVGNTTLSVEVLKERINKGTVIEFSNGTAMSLSEDANKGDEAIIGYLNGSISAGDVAGLREEEGAIIQPTGGGAFRYKRLEIPSLDLTKSNGGFTGNIKFDPDLKSGFRFDINAGENPSSYINSVTEFGSEYSVVRGVGPYSTGDKVFVTAENGANIFPLVSGNSYYIYARDEDRFGFVEINNNPNNVGDVLFFNNTSYPFSDLLIRKDEDSVFAKAVDGAPNLGLWESNIKKRGFIIADEIGAKSDFNPNFTSSGTDSREAIQEAVDIANRLGIKEVWLLGRNYKIVTTGLAQGLVAKNGVSLVGKSGKLRNASGLMRVGDDVPLLTYSGDVGSSFANDIGFENIQFIEQGGKGAGAGANTSDLVKISYAGHVDFQFCRFTASAKTSLNLSGSQDSRINYCRFDESGARSGELSEVNGVLRLENNNNPTNQIHINNTVFESYNGEAIVAVNQSNEIFMQGVKLESGRSNTRAALFDNCGVIHFSPLQVYSKGDAGNTIPYQVLFNNSRNIFGTILCEHSPSGLPGTSAALLNHFINIQNCRSGNLNMGIYKKSEDYGSGGFYLFQDPYAVTGSGNIEFSVKGGFGEEVTGFTSRKLTNIADTKRLLRSPDGSVYEISVDNTGTIQTTAL